VNGRFLDLASLKPVPITFEKDGWEPAAALIASADGTVYTRWGEEAVAYVLEGDRVTSYREGGLGHAIPGPDGQRVFTSNGVVTAKLTRADPEDAKFGFCIRPSKATASYR
jgi:hypothetical protein